MRQTLVGVGICLGIMLCGLPVRADVNPIVVLNLVPDHDTYATHDDGLAHGTETFIRVGIEPQQCVPGGYDPCEDDDMECCIAGSGYNYCAPPGECGTTTPSWSAFRKYRGYLRYDLSSVPEGQIVSASLRMTALSTVQEMGGPFKLKISALKSIGFDPPVCAWNEATLNDTNGTTWSSLPQNVSVTEEGMWFFDVTKAVTDWVNGDQDLPGTPVKDNCGFHLYDDDFGNAEAPIQRWVDFGSKESPNAPQLKIEVAQDLDNDGYFGDCNEEDPNINPGAVEICDDVDNDCDGKIDEENCDGLDNDCDGAIDEDEGMCGEGMLCIYHECYPVCEDECGSSYSLKCVLNDDGHYERWGCKVDADADPCWDWYKAEDCDPGDFCEYGYCSGNCVDTCDEQGVSECYEDTTGKWFVGTCDDWDLDGCLELGDLKYCGPGATCEDSQCNEPCTDECELGLTQCAGESVVQACYDWDEDGCLEWAEVASCDPAEAPCEDGECGGVPEPCEDDCLAGALMCDVEDGIAYLFECVADQDADPCLEWGNMSECPPPGECNEMQNGCAEEPVEPELDVITQPDNVQGEAVEEIMAPDVPAVETDVPGTPDSAADVPGTAETTGQPDGAAPADTGWQPDLTGGDSEKKKDDGCAMGSSAHPTAALLLVLALFGLAVLRRRNRRLV